MSNDSNDKYELLCNPTDDSNMLNKERVLVPFKNDIMPDTKGTIITKKMIKIILISLSSIIIIIIFAILLKRMVYNMNLSSNIKLNIKRK